MRRLATATAAVAPPPPPPAVVKVHLWTSPIPYLFGGLSLTMLLIAGALIILACSFRKRFTTVKKDPPPAALDLVMEQPKILVIMAGDNMPTFLALPATAAAALPPCSCSANQQDDKQNPSP